MPLTIDETIDLLLSEKPDSIMEALELIHHSKKLENMIINSFGASILLIDKKNIYHLKLYTALIYLVGRHQAISELVGEPK